MDITIDQIYFAVMVTLSIAGLSLGLQIGKMIRHD